MSAMLIPLSRTKIVVPTRRPEILTRERLLDLLYDLLDKRLILIAAPAGYGKTSLLIDLAQHTEIPLCWLSLDVLDKDPQRFIAYFIAAFSQRFLHFGKQSTSALNGLTSLDQGLENLIVTLVNEIYEQISEHFVLVLDDYQFVDNIPEIRDFVSRFIQLASENCHLVLSSRRLPALPDLTTLVAREQVGGLSFQELAFQPDEIHSLFEKNYGLHLPEDTVIELAQQTEGWITSLHLSKSESARALPDLARAARTFDVDIADYLNRQVLEGQSLELRSFLLQTSLLDEFDVELCASVLGPLRSGPSLNWEELIASVRQNNLFVLPVGPEGKWLRYHHLFQDFLQARIESENPEQARAILYRLAEVHEKRDDWEKTYHVYQQLGDIDALAGLVERAGTPMIQNSHFITLGNWLDDLPDALVQERPGLLSLKGAIDLIKGQVRHGLSLLIQAEAAFRAKGDSPNLALMLVRRAWAHRLLGNYAASITDADEALQVATKKAALKSILAEAQRMKGLSLYRLGQARQAIPWLEQSLENFTSLNWVRNIPMVQMELGIAYRATGNYEAAKTFYDKALETWKKEGNLTWQANVLNSLGVLYHFQGEYEQAVLLQEQGLDCARRSGYVHAEALILTSLGDLYVELGELDIAQLVYERAEDIARQTTDHFLINYLNLSQAEVARLRHNYDRARLLLDAVRPLVQEDNSNYEQGLYALESGKLHLSEGNTAQVVQELQTAIHHFIQGELALETGWSRLWLAAAYCQFGNLMAARTELKKVLSLANLEQASHSLSMSAHQVQNCLGNLRTDPEVGPALTSLLNLADQVETRFPNLRKRLRRLTSTVPLPPPRLIIHALGKSRVRLNGKLVSSAQWQTLSVRELFFFFLTTSRPVTKEEVGVVFWPEVSTEQLKLRFKNNIYRLRRALGPDTILFEGDLYRFNSDLDYEYDVDAFEAALNKAKTAQDAQEQIACYQMAVDLVRGLYLEDIDAGWVMAERERLEQDYLSALVSLAKLLLNDKKKKEALQACQRAIIRNACYEEAHRLAMQIYTALGDRPAIVRQYQTCREALEAELGVPPSFEMEELYRRLIS